MWSSQLTFLSCEIIRIQNVVIFDAFKRGMTRVTIKLDSQQLLAEQGQEFSVGGTAIRAGYLHMCLGVWLVQISLLLHELVSHLFHGNAPS